MNQIITQLNAKTMEDIVNNLKRNQSLIIQFTATWCKPCKKLKPLCNQYYNSFSDNVIIAVLDVDNNLDIYSYYKRKRLVSGLPSFLIFLGSTQDRIGWYAPDFNITGPNNTNLIQLFTVVKKHEQTQQTQQTQQTLQNNNYQDSSMESSMEQ